MLLVGVVKEPEARRFWQKLPYRWQREIVESIDDSEFATELLKDLCGTIRDGLWSHELRQMHVDLQLKQKHEEPRFAGYVAKELAEMILLRWISKISTEVLQRLGSLEDVGHTEANTLKYYVPGSPGIGGRTVVEDREFFRLEWDFHLLRGESRQELRRRGLSKDSMATERDWWKSPFQSLADVAKKIEWGG